MKIVIILLGPKGLGKTYIGTELSKIMEVYFLRVENIWLSLKSGEDGWKVVEEDC